MYLFCGFASYFSIITLFIFITIAELIFWDEFGTRFNFIAVDYLIYTHEIIGTIRESVPYIPILLSIILISLFISLCSRKYIIKQLNSIQKRNNIYSALTSLILALLAFNLYNPNKINFSVNKYALELGKNGYYEFFSAFYHNSLDYNSFFPVLDNQKALNIVRTSLATEATQYLDNSTINRRITTNSPNIIFSDNFVARRDGAKPIDNRRATSNDACKFVSEDYIKKYNIIVITVESLSSEFMGQFGNKQNITPNLDKLAGESIFFTNIYAVGTRTVRGLEAITLSVPPTPGSSIIRRPNNQSLFNIATIFKQRGYNINFIFGGYSYFDNLQDYFQGNGYNIVDRNSLKPEEISFSNIWGVADEDILNKSLEIADQNYQEGKAFFSLIMTTSNHRPYTFPKDRINLPSGSGRSAAVKYTDYAIGRFLDSAKTRPWFENTLFVITADHCASSAGKTDLPINKYHIPLLIYAPGILTPQIVDKLASQIDIAPTIFGLLNFSYNSKFFGQDILNSPPNRAFISTYQLLGFMKDDHLVILGPKTKTITYKLTGKDRVKVDNITSLVEEAISFYQIAYNLYIKGDMRE
ncbi:LTA synthase family protein [Candidatus Tisiphia endosymbiont of Beris chalybata]|uniref:LTA synthase family protein n=1 Tax=Candidatus Tisiphia endosymbiont of Beris chalybata TaxID=3066262 RepID=UPI00312C8C73